MANKHYVETEDRLHSVASNVVMMAISNLMWGNPNDRQVQQALLNDQELPEHCKPGRVIMGMKEEDRKLVKKLKAEHFNDRQI